MEKKKVVYYTSSEGCTPCAEISKLVEEGKFSCPDSEEVDVVDINTDEGFDRFAKDVLSKSDGAVPTAYIDGKKCQIDATEDWVFINCPKDDLPEAPAGISSPPETGAEHGDVPSEPPAASPEP